MTLMPARVQDSRSPQAALLVLVSLLAFSQLLGRPEQRAERVVQEVEAGGCIEVSVAHQLAGEEHLAEATAEQAAHRAIAQVQLPGDSPNLSLGGVEELKVITASIHVPGAKIST